MWLFWALLLAEIVSILVCLFGIKRLYKYIRRYRFPENVYTLLFGFLHLHYFVLGYLLCMGLATVTGILFAFSLFSHDIPA